VFRESISLCYNDPIVIILFQNGGGEIDLRGAKPVPHEWRAGSVKYRLQRKYFGSGKEAGEEMEGELPPWSIYDDTPRSDSVESEGISSLSGANCLSQLDGPRHRHHLPWLIIGKIYLAVHHFENVSVPQTQV
jgi:hypothetical protein